MVRSPLIFRCLCGLVCASAFAGGGVAAESDDVAGQLRALAEQNRRLQEQVAAQQATIWALAAKLEAIERQGTKQASELEQLRERTSEEPATLAKTPVESGAAGTVRISGEAGLAFFRTGRSGQFPKDEFRLDDARLFVEATVIKDVYVYAQFDVRTRETDETFDVAEFYVDFEDVSGRLGGPARLVNVRAGQFNVPFGEEYQARGPVANPLISHSLPDIWGYDPGVEIYGAAGAWDYVVAVQNGGLNTLRDRNADKAVTARVGWSPRPWLRLSASAGRTGELEVTSGSTTGDDLSALWFAGGFFKNLSGTARNFRVNLGEADATVRWSGGHVSAALGGVRYADRDPAASGGGNRRRLSYGFLEAVQELTPGLYGAARYSEIQAPGGYPLTGWGAMGRFFFSPAPAEELKRLSLGFGYKFGPPLVVKLEYTWEWGHQLSGAARDDEDFFGAEVGVTF